LDETFSFGLVDVVVAALRQREAGAARRAAEAAE
jgi:hypothetical protein